MQASKIVFSKEYAVKRKNADGEEEIVRFSPDSIITVRRGPKHVYNKVEGKIIEDQPTDEQRANGQEWPTVTYLVENILGEIEQYQALIDKRNAEKAAKDAKEAARKAKLVRLWELLYQVTGMVKPKPDPNRLPSWRKNDHPSEYSDQPFRVDYAGVDIKEGDAVEILTEVLEQTFTIKTEEPVNG